MKNQTINLKYSLARAKALSHYLEKNGSSIEGELLNHIDELYDAHVPEVVREFVASQNPEIEQDEHKPEEPNHGKSAKLSSRRKQSNIDDQSDSGPVLVM